MLVGGHAFNDEKAMATGALLNTLWDGNPIRRVRVLTGNAFLPGRRCSTHMMMQRVVADKLLGDAVLDGIGLMARMLIVEPESTVGNRPFREAPAECAPILAGICRPDDGAADARTHDGTGRPGRARSARHDVDSRRPCFVGTIS